MTLDQFLRRYATNDNEWWKLEPGEMQKMFDEAIEEIKNLQRALSLIDEARAKWVAEAERLRGERSNLYRRVELNANGETDEPVQFVGVYVTQWGRASEPTVAFVEWQEDRL